MKFQRVFIAVLVIFALAALCPAQNSTPAQKPAQTPAPSATSAPADAATQEFDERIAENMRARFSIPSRVQIVVGPRGPSTIPGYDSLKVTLVNGDRKSPYDFFISKDGTTLAQLNKIDVSQNPFDTAGRPSRGAKDAKVTVIVWDDFECPYCARGYQTLFKEIMPQYQDRIRVVYKDFPLYEIHPWAIHAAVDANCLFAQSNDAYWDFADYVHTNRDSIQQQKALADQFASLDKNALASAQKFNLDSGTIQTCVKAQDDTAVMASSNYGDRALGIDATPTLYVNGTKLDGAVPADDLREVLNAALKEQGVAPPPGTEAKIVPDQQAIDNALKNIPKPAGQADPKSATTPPTSTSPANANSPPPKNP